MTLEGVRFIPALAGYKETWIPGCVIEAMVKTANGGEGMSSQEAFNKQAKELGFYAPLVNPQDRGNL